MNCPCMCILGRTRGACHVGGGLSSGFGVQEMGAHGEKERWNRKEGGQVNEGQINGETAAAMGGSL